MVATFEDRVQVGVVAVNSSSKSLKAEFEGFQVIGGAGAEAHDGADAPQPRRRCRPLARWAAPWIGWRPAR